eukprot:TRINITY_DN5376_c1_g1_i4.p1 TRINITY_DN5376_c1_g1~~TRINITY_DN5376_c1_g1_i4.p1  ORF type:complete len:1090 (-),score=83.59 TRINITY_DN5376_c1_g1_i4:958-3894(-)
MRQILTQKKGHFITMKNKFIQVEMKSEKEVGKVADYSRILVKDLVVGQTHRNKVFCGQIIELPVVVDAVHVIAEDFNEDVVQISIYNMNLTSWEEADNIFKKGYEISVYDPFMKAFQNGGVGIRVDNPKEIFIQAKAQEINFHEEGNKLFSAKQFQSACDYYSKALQQKQEVAKLLANIAACLLKVNQPVSALGYACSAVRVDDSYEKGWFRINQCLQSLKKMDEFDCILSFAPPQIQAMYNARKVQLTQGQIPLSYLISKEISLLQQNQNNVIEGSFEDLKARGNDAFRSKDTGTALELYLNALEYDKKQVSTLLKNRAACYIQLTQPLLAMMDSFASLLILYQNNEKGMYHLAQALRELGQIEIGVQVLQSYTQQETFKSNPRFEQLVQELETMRLSQVATSSGAYRGQSTQEDYSNNVTQEGRARGHELAHMESLKNFLPQHLREITDEVMYDRRIPNFYQEFMKEGHLPPQCDLELTDQWILQAYQDSIRSTKRLLMEKFILQSKGKQGKDLLYNNQQFLMKVVKRLGTNSKERTKWWTEADFGSVNLLDRGGRYPLDNLHSYSNTWGHPVDLQYGQTFVAVGYVDFTTLLNANYIGEVDKPIKFIGYEQSVYSTAKFQIITQMMKMSVHPDEILQVWYSSGWSNQTLQDFRDAANALLKDDNMNVQVSKLIRHWLGAQLVSLLKAQQIWLKNHPQNECVSNNLLNKQDRIQMTEYTITGRLLECDVGSVVMFANPDSFPHLVLNEYVTWQLREEEVNQNYRKFKAVLDVFIGLTLEKIKRLCEEVQNGTVQIDLRVATVSPDDCNILKEIKAHCPDTMFWSNLVDYYGPSKFHEMAKACSTQDTVHYIQSMNWIQEVKGAATLDYPLDTQQKLYNLAKENSVKYFLQLQEFQDAPSVSLQPPADNPWNIVDGVLSGQYKDEWADVFFSKGGVPPNQVAYVLVYPYSIYSRSQGNMYICYTYSKSIRFDHQIQL